MNTLHQSPAPGTTLRRFAGDVLEITLRVPANARGRAFVRTNVGHAREARAERLAAAREARIPLATDWRDLPMQPLRQGVYSARIPLAEPGLFAAKALFLPDGADEPLWPDGADLRIKVASALSAARNSIYTAFPRQFLSAKPENPETRKPAPQVPSAALDNRDVAVIPPSGTFREVARRLDHILGSEGMGFGILQLLPIHPVPTVYARMGRYGSPFAALDFLAVDPALAEFDPAATPMDQFQELLYAVHARGARLFLDLPANHTGWASTALAHHPEWFRREDGGRFHSPGAWGVVWEDLVELDHRRPGVREFIAEVFEFWCAKGVDGFRCDAGYMIPADVWSYVVDHVRSRFPDTVFFLEGLGGSVETTRALLDTAGLDTAYSEVFQTEDRSAFERYLPGAQALSDTAGPLVHFAETHDNLRLAARSPAYARMRVRLAALLSSEGAFGITNGVEWFATEKVDVHGASDLNWGAKPNLVDDIRRLHALLGAHPAFGPGAAIEMVQQGPGNSLAVLRTANCSAQGRSRPCCLVLANLDAEHPQPVQWPAARFDAAAPVDLLSGAAVRPEAAGNGLARLVLEPAQVLCLATSDFGLRTSDSELRTLNFGLDCRLRAAVLASRDALAPGSLAPGEDPAALAAAFAADPYAALAALSGTDAPPRVTELRLPADFRRIVPVPSGHMLLVRADAPFRVGGGALPRVESVPLDDGSFAAVIGPLPAAPANAELTLDVQPGIAPSEPRPNLRRRPFTGLRDGSARPPRGSLCLLALGTTEPMVRTSFSGEEIRRDPSRTILLTNGRGAMAHVRAAWPAIASRYDALLAANPDPAVPCDRWMLLTRCRLWLRHVGTSQPLDANCLERLDTAPDSARWVFRAPIGRGETARVAVELRMPPGRNAVALSFQRIDGNGEQVTGNGKQETGNGELETGNGELETGNGELETAPLALILRPDIESRSFHDVTKAYAGAERAWPAACALAPKGAIGVDFRPAGRPGLALRASCGEYVPEPEWSYCVALPFDAQRGMEASCDLFSPGYFRLPLSSEATLVASETSESEIPKTRHPAAKTRNPEIPETRATLPLSSALTSALRAYVVARDDVQTVIAGYPWFLDWGRDTFIVLRGMLAADMLDESVAIVRAFARFERNGTLPNMIRGNDDSNRDTSDAPLWFSVAAHDLCDRLGRDRALSLDCGGRTLADVLEGIAAGYRHGTPNGIAMDLATGLVFSPSHFTWMDTNFPAGTPRRGYPVEIQALWISALRFLAEIRPGGDWGALADRAAESVRRLFWLPERGFFSDCLHADRPGAPATPDDALRPNQLLLFTLGALDARGADATRLRATLRACAALLVPGAIRTLADAPVTHPQPVERDGHLLNDPLHPYWGRYEGDEDTRRKPAYHNGTAWTWPFPLYAEALLAAYGPAAASEARALLASGAGLVESGAIGHLPEILDGDAPHEQRGCDAQAWGVSEFVRVFRLLDDVAPKVP